MGEENVDNDSLTMADLNICWEYIFDEMKPTEKDNHVAKFSAEASGHSLQIFSLASIVTESVSDEKNDQCHIVHEGVFSKLYCLRDSENRFSSRTGFVALKTLSDEISTHDEVSRIQNEYTISRKLAHCDTVRSALAQVDVDGKPVFFLEWVNGISLAEWISSFHKQKKPPSLDTKSSSTPIRYGSDMKITLRLAKEITGALVNIHDAGVIHNNLTPENIIVEINNGTDDLYVKVIGLGSAYLQKDSTQGKRKDLVSLGAVLFEMFTGQSPFRKNCGDNSHPGEMIKDAQSKIFLSQNHLIATLTARVPIAIAKLALSLMEIERYSETPSYGTAKDAYSFLSFMMRDSGYVKSKYIQITSLGRLHIPEGKLYGRDSHVAKLMNICSKIGTIDESRMVLISGYSGAGKSAMVGHVKANLKERNNLHFICGKFDRQQQAEPLSAINAALVEYSNDIINKDLETIEETRRAIFDAINTDIGVLTELFPCLCKIVGKPTTIPTEVDSMAAQNRFKFIFRMFVRAIATPSRPIVLFLDDLQWADELSLQLVAALVSDTEIGGLLFIGSFRDNEIDATHRLTILINELERKKIAISNINVASIPKEDVNVMISDSVCMQQHLTKSLSDIIYRKTSGNALFVTQFLQSLWDEGLLLFSLASNTWQWSTEAIDAKNVADDVGVLMSAKILQLPLECQYALKLFACLGSRCDASILRLFMGREKGSQGEPASRKRQRGPVGSRYEFPMLDFATNEGLLKKEGSIYMFAHDQVQHEVYSLIPEGERGNLHNQIGRLILKHVSDDELDDILFISVDQLNQGKMSITGKDKRIELAKLNLRAAEKAMSLATFLSALSYLRAGMGMLYNNHWVKHYDLSLQLYSSCAEAEYCIGHFQEVGRVAGIVIKEAKSFKDKLSVYATLIKALSAKNNTQDAIEIGFSVLEKLGVQCQSQLPHKKIVIGDLMTTKKAFEDLTDSEFLDLKEMNDTNIISAMKFFNLLLPCSYWAKQEYFPIILTKMMRLTLTYGVCKESCVALAYCNVLLVALQDFKGAERIGHLAFLLLEELKAEEYKPHVQVCVNGGIIPWIKQTKLSLGPLMDGYKVGMERGDILTAMSNAFVYISHSLISGQNLVELARDIEVYGKQMAEHELTGFEAINPLKQAVTCLVSGTYNSSLLFCQTTEYSDMVAQAFKEEKHFRVSQLFFFGGFVAYIFGEYDSAADLVQKRKEVEKVMSRSSLLCGMVDFFDGLIFLAMACKSADECDTLKWNSLASNAISKLETFAEIGKPNFESKLLLLQAETKNIMEEKEDALEKYEMAIVTAEKNDLIHEQAIATERLADFLMENSDEAALGCYGKALSLYQQWGAQRKVDHLSKNMPF